MPRRIIAFVLSCALLGSCGGAKGERSANVIRLGHFPNITHAQGLVAHQLSRRGQGRFESHLPPGTVIEWYVYNAGPSAMEALLAGTLDATYVGPNPALNAYAKTEGADVRVLAGATLGGAALVVHSTDALKTPADFRGKRIATPQLGNTQDVACRAWLAKGGLRVTTTGGDVNVLPTANPDQLALFSRGELEGVWTVEPWVSRLEREAGGKILVAEDDAITTILVSSAKALAERRDLMRALTKAHEELTQWIVDNPEEARRLVQAELRDETKQQMAPRLLEQAWPRLRFDAHMPREEFSRFVDAARAVGFLKDAPSLDRFTETP